MNDFRPSIGSNSPDPYNKIKVESITKKHEEEKETAKIKIKKRSAFSSVILFVSNKLLSLFPQRTPIEAFLMMENDLTTIKKCFISLMNNDLSQDVYFLKELSDHWMNFIEDFSTLLYSKHPMIAKIHAFLNDIDSFPQNQQYSLGYYLSEYAGLKWTPFPYMTLLKNLYLENQQNPTNSRLHNWIKDIDDIISIENE